MSSSIQMMINEIDTPFNSKNHFTFFLVVDLKGFKKVALVAADSLAIDRLNQLLPQEEFFH